MRMTLQRMKKKSNLSYYFITIAAVAVSGWFFVVSPLSFTNTYEIVLEDVNAENNHDLENAEQAAGHENVEFVKPKIKHVKTPDQVKAIYMTACVASTRNFRNELVELIEETEINSIVIDIKDYSGTISFDSGLDGDGGTGCRANDMEEFVETLHEKGIYVIARLSTFQDSYYGNLHPQMLVKKASNGSTWTDYKGINFIDVHAKDFWQYILDLSIKANQIGFDEINYDYIRFPSDGNMKDIYFPFSNKIIEKNIDEGKAIALEDFFKFLRTEIDKYNKDIEQPLIISADLFGMVTTANDDLNIGQVLERTLPYFDYISPMVYPSHYPPGFNGWKDPNTVPYELIHHVMTSGIEKVEALASATTTPDYIKEKIHPKQLRPWIQDFDYGGIYGPKEVRAQIDATYDAGLDSWMLWAPSNRYTRAALKDK